MSVIVYRPQGCGKTLHAEALRRHFKCTQVVEDDFDNIYERVRRDPTSFKCGATLYLTHIPPPAALAGARRIVSFDAAMAGIRRSAA